MVNDIRTAFTEIVMELDWMDAETKERTLEKAHAMRPFIGFPGWLLTPGELEKYYEGVSSCVCTLSLVAVPIFMCINQHTCCLFQAEVVDGLLFETYLRLSEESVKTAVQDLHKAPDYNR